MKLYKNDLILELCNLVCIRPISTTPTINLIQKWRKDRGLPLNPNSSGVLTDGPDYTYLDGRPTPYCVRQKKRLIKQKELAEAIITLTKEVDFAVERHARLQKEEEDRRKEIIGSKLKPKGLTLLPSERKGT